MLEYWLGKSGKNKAVWLTHRKELANQTAQMLGETGVRAIVPKTWRVGQPAPAREGTAIVLMAQTVGLRNKQMKIWGNYGANDLLVIDEAHHAAASSWERAMQEWTGPIVGMTATPWRMSETQGFEHLFDELVHGPQIADLQASNWLCEARVIIPPPTLQIEAGEISDITRDYTSRGVSQANSDRPGILTAGVLKFWQEYAEWPSHHRLRSIR